MWTAKTVLHRASIRTIACCLTIVMFSLVSPSALAQLGASTPAQTATAAEQPAPPVVPAARANARATMRTFLKSMEAYRGEHPERIADAVACLDLSEISEIVHKEKGRELAETLLEVIDRTRYVDYSEIPDDPAGPPYVFLERAEGAVVIARQDTGEWLFTKETVADLPELFKAVKREAVVEEVAEKPRPVSTALTLRTVIPDSLQERVFLLEHWQWLGLFLLALVGMILDRVVSFTCARAAQQWSRSRGLHRLEDVFESKLWRPLGLLAASAFWWLTLTWLALPDTALAILLLAVKVAATGSAVWAAYKLVDVLAAYLEHRASGTDSKLDDLLVPMVRRSLKVFIVAFGLVFIADNLNINVTSLLAGIGLGGLAFALAARDTISNLFGSLTVILDRPFHIGDWVVIGEIEGTVETVGFRSTRIRTFYNSLVTIPNSQLISASVDNYGLRRYRRIRAYLSLTYDTPPEKIDAFCEGIRELIRRHPYTRKDYFQVYLNQFGAHSLDVLLYCFHEAPDWSTELRERHRLFLDILRLAEQLDVQFAFPTQTLHLHDGGPWRTPESSLAGETQAFEAGRTLAASLSRQHWDGNRRPSPVVFVESVEDETEQEQRDAGS